MTREYPAIKACAEWFEANREDLLPKYSGRYLAIADGRVLGDYADQLEGIQATLGSGRVAGTFIVHQCVPKEDEPRIICHWQMRSPLPL